MKRLAVLFLVALLLLPGMAQAKIFLVDTDDTLRVVTASGVSTIHMYAAWADITTTALTPGSSTARVTTATTTALVGSPSASTQRQIKGFSIRNAHASSSNVITVQFFDGTNATELIQYTLLAGETLQWGEDENFRVIDASGQVKGLVALATGTNSVGQVTANAGTNLNTSSLLTTTAHDAAFGTAGSADSQVRSVQGIASMTPLLVNPGTATNFGVYAEDSIHASGDNLVLAGVVRSDAAAALAADGDRTVLQVDANGYLKVVNINPNLAADNSTLSTAKVPVLPGTVSTSAPTWTNGNQSALSLQTDGSVRAAITNTVTVSDGSGALNVICDSGCSGGTQYNQGTAGTATDTLSMAGAIRKDTAAADAGAIDGDRIVLSTDSVGRLRTTSADTTQPVSGTVTVTATNLDVQIGGSDSLTIGTFPDNEPFNVAQINGVTPLMGAGNTGTGSLRVTIATDQAALNGLGVYVEDAAETAGGNLSMAGSVRRDTAASSAGTTGDNATINTDATGLLWTRTIDACSSGAKTFLPINISTATTTEITPSLAGASTNYYICSLVLVTAAANNIALVDDDSDGCGSVTSGLAGGTTAGSGFNMAANSGMTFGNGMGSVFKTNGTNRVVCLVTSATTQLSGTMSVVAAP